MPKIPTFQARGDITTEAPTVRTGIQLSPTATPGAALLKPVMQIAEYYEREKLIAEKADADKQYLELSSELDDIEANASKLFNPTEAQTTFNSQARFLIKQKIDQNKNKRIKKMLSDTFEQDVIIRSNNVKKLSRQELDKQEEYNFNTKYQINLSKYKLATSQEEKDIYANQIFKDQESRSLFFNDSESTKNIEMDSIKKDLLLSDVDQLIQNKQYESAKNILEDIDNTPYLDADKRTEILNKIQKESLEYNETNFHVNNLVKGFNSLIGADLKYTDNKTILQQTDNVLFAEAEQKNYGPEETFAHVDNSYANNGLVSSTYKDLIEVGYNTGSSTTFDSPADIPQQLIQAVKAAETADKFGRLNVYTSTEQERFYTNIITLKKINGLSDFEAIKQAKEFENNYEVFITKASGKQRGKTLTDIEEKFEDINATNMNEVKSYGEKLYNMYLGLGVRDREARKKVIEDLDKNIEVIDNYAYLKRDIVAFQSIDGMQNIPVYKKFIIKNNISETEDPDDYYLRHNGGGQFEIRRKVDLSTVLDKNNNPMIFYPNDLLKIKNQQTEEFKKDILEEQRKTQEGRRFVTEQEIYFP